ncbi:hypothetical protein CIHG_03514 [Coccidioides immitis H538.4]|uniref:RING-type domain-containing protein n=2 Tax=Coccidioides immitis TaxID=5501 RepID=A0A0J8RPR7_COCIT|nr:hypothetical protein CIRG_08866 [Coccidioides immitis RMSCC 2394]KMU85984.1 hypothetical protein CIHG_03514 [Coccidioides immitis H538.4]
MDLRSRSPKRTDPTGLLRTFQKDIDDIRNLIYCGVCVRPLYEPFTLGCGHTFCYSCLTQWFLNHQRKKTCPDCRAAVWSEPAPAYMIRNIVQIFITRPELLDKDETTAEHLKNQRAETEKLDLDKKDLESGGLFQGCFRHTVIGGVPIEDLADGVERCPRCTWELEDGDCIHCGFIRDQFSEDDYYDSDSETAMMEVFGDPAYASRFDSEELMMMDDAIDNESYMDDERHFYSLSDSTSSRSEDEDSDDMGSFIDDEEDGEDEDEERGEEEYEEDSDTTTPTIVGNNDYLTEDSLQSPTTGDRDMPSEIADSMSEGASEHVFEGFFGNATVINLDDDDEDDEPVRMTSRRRRQISPSSASGSHTTVPRSQASPTPSTHDSSSDDEPRDEETAALGHAEITAHFSTSYRFGVDLFDQKPTTRMIPCSDPRLA